MNEYDLKFEKIIKNYKFYDRFALPDKFNNKLSEDFIRKYKDKLYWGSITPS